MLLPVFRDLIKLPWRTVLEELKIAGDLPVSELARKTGGSYMAVKAHCEDLTKAGYLVRTRLPRTEVGRPEIFYSLAAKSDSLFPQAGVDFTIELLAELRLMYGETAPEKLLFQYFQKRLETWAKVLDKMPDPADKAAKLCTLRTKDGCACRCDAAPGLPLRIIEHHNPLQRLFEHYPRAVTMELRMLEQLLGCRITRNEMPAGRQTTPHVEFTIS